MSLFIMWSAFLRATHPFLISKTFLITLAFVQSLLFQIFVHKLVDPRYLGYEIGFVMIFLKLIFSGGALYAFWSLTLRKEELLKKIDNDEIISDEEDSEEDDSIHEDK